MLNTNTPLANVGRLQQYWFMQELHTTIVHNYSRDIMTSEIKTPKMRFT